MVLTPDENNRYSKFQLSCIYGKYIDADCFLNNYLRHLAEEYHALLEHFPGFLIDTTARIKSPSSYFEKIEKHEKAGKSIALSDVYANKYILYSMNGTSDEQTLINGLYSIRDFLIRFNQEKQGFSEITSSRKDYIARPKIGSGYQSLHLNFQSQEEPDLRHETQIKTFRMRENELTGPYGHHLFYKPLGNLSNIPDSKIPMYIEPIFTEDEFLILDDNGLPIFRTLSLEESKKRFTQKRAHPQSKNHLKIKPQPTILVPSTDDCGGDEER